MEEEVKGQGQQELTMGEIGRRVDVPIPDIKEYVRIN
jgi:hypothetical protein